MATKKEINAHLNQALKEIGKIKPWFDKDFNNWIFSHHLYPVEYAGDTREEVVENYPRYLEEFIKHRLDDRLSPIMAKDTKGHGGKRPGAGRPKGTTPKKRIYVSLEMYELLNDTDFIEGIIKFSEAFKRHPNHI